MSLRVGIVGFGRIGAEHARWIESAGAQLVAVADATEARRTLVARFAPGADAVADPAELLSRDDVDAVLIATPTSMHFEHAQAALRAGKHVMVEKPVTLNHQQAIELRDEARRQNRVVEVFHNRRWDVDFLTLRKAIERGVFGRVFHVESRLGQYASCVGPAAKEFRPNWRNEAEFGGGGLFDWGSHFIDQILQLMLPARPVRVFAQMRGNVWSRDCDDFARVLIDFEDAKEPHAQADFGELSRVGSPCHGATALVEINTTTTRPLPRWHVDGERGSAESPFSLAFDTNEWAKFTVTSPDGESKQLPIASRGLDEPEVWRRFFAACRREGEPAVGIESVLTTMRLLDAAHKSSRLGIAMSFDSQEL